MPAATARGDSALCSQHVSQWQRGACARWDAQGQQCTQSLFSPGAQRDHARRKCTRSNGIDPSTRKMSTDQGNLCSMLKQITAMPIVSQGYNITSSQLHLESVCCRRLSEPLAGVTHHVALVPSFCFQQREKWHYTSQLINKEPELTLTQGHTLFIKGAHSPQLQTATELKFIMA